jgi:hypothetical protein
MSSITKKLKKKKSKSPKIDGTDGKNNQSQSNNKSRNDEKGKEKEQINESETLETTSYDNNTDSRSSPRNVVSRRGTRSSSTPDMRDNLISTSAHNSDSEFTPTNYLSQSTSSSASYSRPQEYGYKSAHEHFARTQWEGPDGEGAQVPKSGIVKLNIGGVKYETTVGTLTSKGDNFFTTLFSNKFRPLIDDQGYYFIDRDGEYFKPLLSFLRTGELRIPVGMSKVCVEREAHFYLIDLNEDRPRPTPPPYFPSPAAASFSPSIPARNFLRYDGVYLQKTRDGEDFFAYYKFYRGGKVVIVTASHHKVVNKVNNTYEIIEGEWLLIRAGFQRKTVLFFCSFGFNCIHVHWRSPLDRKHIDGNTLFFFPSMEPVFDLIYSNQYTRARKRQYHRLAFKAENTVTITVMEKEEQHRLRNSTKRTVPYRIEKEEVCNIFINDDFYPEGMLCLGSMLLEKRMERQAIGHREVFRIYLAMERQEDEEEDEIDIYTFLRTSVPPVSNENDFSSGDDDYYDPYTESLSTRERRRSMSQ